MLERIPPASKFRSFIRMDEESDPLGEPALPHAAQEPPMPLLRRDKRNCRTLTDSLLIP